MEKKMKQFNVRTTVKTGEREGRGKRDAQDHQGPEHRKRGRGPVHNNVLSFLNCRWLPPSAHGLTYCVMESLKFRDSVSYVFSMLTLHGFTQSSQVPSRPTNSTAPVSCPPRPSLSQNNPRYLWLQNKLSNIFTQNISPKYSFHDFEKGQIFLPGDRHYLPISKLRVSFPGANSDVGHCWLGARPLPPPPPPADPGLFKQQPDVWPCNPRPFVSN